jgi:hypothetical protein
LIHKTSDQGDQIGRLFTFGSSAKIRQVAQITGLLISTVKVLHVFLLTQTGWAAFWAIFSQTHLVALPRDIEDATYTLPNNLETNFPL